VIAREGSRSTLLIGSRVPIAVSEVSRQEDGEARPTTTYAYQNIGFSAELMAWVLPNGKINVEAEIESSQISPETASADHPVILTYQQRVQVVLEDGKPMRVTRVEDPERVNGHFEIIAKIVE
jgi:type II secretory pathway component GspD/PulD (secretin)